MVFDISDENCCSFCSNHYNCKYHVTHITNGWMLSWFCMDNAHYILHALIPMTHHIMNKIFFCNETFDYPINSCLFLLILSQKHEVCIFTQKLLWNIKNFVTFYLHCWFTMMVVVVMTAEAVAGKGEDMALEYVNPFI